MDGSMKQNEEGVTDASPDRYERLRGVLPMDAAKNALAVVGGAGALGNEILKNLALLGVGHVLVCDLDTIEIHNLTRAVLFRREDAGRPKAEAAADRLREINPDVHAMAFPKSISELGLGFYRRADFIFSTFDAFFPRFVVNEGCMRTRAVWIDGGMSELNHARGAVTIYDASDPENYCYACSLSPEGVSALHNRLRGENGCQAQELQLAARGGVPSTPMTASIIGGIQLSAGMFAFQRRLGQDVGDTWAEGMMYFDVAARKSKVMRKKRRSPCYYHDLIGVKPFDDALIEMPEWRSDRTTIEDVLERGASDLGTDRVSIQLPEKLITTGKCGACGKPWDLFMPVSANRELRGELQCSTCGAGPFVASEAEGLVSEYGRHSELVGRVLGEAGIRELDIITVVSHDEMDLAADARYYEITGDVDRLGIAHGTGTLRPQATIAKEP